LCCNFVRRRFINKKVAEELTKQEIQQKELKTKIEKYEEKNNVLNIKKDKFDQIHYNFVVKTREKQAKAMVFMRLHNFLAKKKLQRKTKRMIRQIYIKNLLRKSVKAWKIISFHQSNKNFEEKIKVKTDLELKNYENNLIIQQEKLKKSIKLAEERLLYEQKKKIQTKLSLDQVVLRGVSALNLQALKLSQNSLNDVYKADYVKEIQKNISNLLFPDTKEGLNNYTKRSENFQTTVNNKVTTTNKGTNKQSTIKSNK